MSELATLEKWIDKATVADYYGCGVRWVEARLHEGMPSAMIAGRRKFKLSKVDPWLRRRGHIREDAA